MWLDDEGAQAIFRKAGDDRLAWNPRDLKQLKEARDKFYSLLDKGYMAYAVNAKTGEANKRKKLIRFEPNAGEVIFTFKDAVEHVKKGRKIVAKPAIAGG